MPSIFSSLSSRTVAPARSFNSWGTGHQGSFTLPKSKENKTPGEIYKSLRHVGVEIETVPNWNNPAQGFYNEFFALDPRAGCGADGGGIELRTPPLAGAAFENYLLEVGKLLDKYEFKMTNDCGAHIHLDANKGFVLKKGIKVPPIDDDDDYNSQFNDEDPYDRISYRGDTLKLASLVRLYAIVETWMKMSLPKWRRTSRWCTDIHGISKDKNFLAVFKEKDQNTQLNLLRSSWNWGNLKSNGLNLAYALGDDGRNYHVEIRYHHGTNDMKDMVKWCALNAALVDFVDENFAKAKYMKAIHVGEKLNWTQIPRFLHQELKISKSLIKYFTKQIKDNQ